MTDSTATHSKPLVVLLHGLHQRAFIMRPLAGRLRRCGYRTHLHDYYSLLGSLKQHSTRLDTWLRQHHTPSQPVHLVGHSLGGLVMRDFIARFRDWHIAPSVTLGTPHLGSVFADYVNRFASPLVGRSYRGGLDGQVAALPDDVCLGVIAGSAPHGVGQPILTYHQRRNQLTEQSKQHDGTVFVSETRLLGASDHLVLPVSHTGMLISDSVAKQTAYFLEHGQFLRGDIHDNP